MTDDQYPLHVFAQVVNDFGAEKGDAFPVHDGLKDAQVGDRIDFKGPQKVEGWDEWPGNGFMVQEREFTTRRESVADKTIHGLTLTLFVRRT